MAAEVFSLVSVKPDIKFSCSVKKQTSRALRRQAELWRRHFGFAQLSIAYAVFWRTNMVFTLAFPLSGCTVLFLK